MISTIVEGRVKIKYPIDSRNKLDSKVPVFYNPVMRLNRDISIIFLNSIERKTKKPLRCLDLLSASGIRALRIKAETPNVEVTANDFNQKAVKTIKRNAKSNKLKIKIENKEAHVLLTELNSYDFIDIDPFGTPVPFLDAAIKRLSPHAYLAVTATDTSALCGTYEYACRRKYQAKPLRNEFMHETAIRILIKKVQEVASQYDIALTPVFSHSSNHYVRVYFKKDVGAKKADKIIREQGYIFYNWKTCERKIHFDLSSKPKNWDYAGVLWLGQLWDKNLVLKMKKFAFSNQELFSKKTLNLISQIADESALNAQTYYDTHQLAKKHKIVIPKMNDLLSKINKIQAKASRTHFSLTGFRTEIKYKKLIKVLCC